MTEAPVQIATVSTAHLVAALAQRIKMKRAPAGVQVTGLKEIALLPAKGGIQFELPGGSAFVPVIAGKWENEVVFAAAKISGLELVLKKYANDITHVIISATTTDLTFRIGGAVLSFPFLKQGNQG